MSHVNVPAVGRKPDVPYSFSVDGPPLMLNSNVVKNGDTCHLVTCGSFSGSGICSGNGKLSHVTVSVV